MSEETDDQLGSPAWSPDGNYIVVRKYGQYPGPTDYLRYTSLWMFHKDGGKGVEVVKGGKGDTAISSGAVFSADGKLVYFSSHAGRYQYNVDIGKFQVMSFNRDTGEIERADVGVWRRTAADRVAGREVAGVRVATGCEDGLADSRSGDARGALAGTSDAARRSRRLCGERSAAGVCVHAGLEGRDFHARWAHPASGSGDATGGDDSVQCEGGSGSGSARTCGLHGGRRAADGAPDAMDEPIARWESRLRSARWGKFG